MTRMRRRGRRSISPGRKGLYYTGMLLQFGGLAGFLACMVGAATGGARVADPGGAPSWWIGCIACMVVAAVGSGLAHVGARGVAGSGLLLDPERARDDLGPWARTGGGLLREALDEAGIGASPRREDPVVKVRCRECGTLNDEDARFCDGCGAKL